MATFAQHHSDTSAAFPAADDISNLLIPHYTLANNIQAKNIIAAAAALTGEWALLSLGLVLPESGFVFGNSVNHVLINGPRAVWPYVEKSAVQAGVANTNLPDIAAAAIRT
ncbi:MAG TPA: hypothetical protein ENJ55_03675, partial [Rhizobiales bacterium]|nr:hypothetical protein [Hyphomicrobiales bacterium]